MRPLASWNKIAWGAAILATTMIVALAVWWRSAWPGPYFSEVRAQFRRSDFQLLDERDRLVQELRVNFEARRREWLPLSRVPPAWLELLIHSEDRRFFEHTGVDWRAVGGALYQKIKGERLRGASTLSMQLVALLDPSLGRAQRGRSLRGKILQMRAARALERHYRKNEILEAYLNLVTFRSDLRGLSAASAKLFGKDLHGLSLSEMSALVVLLQNPNLSPRQVETKACALLKRKYLDAGSLCEKFSLGVAAPPAMARRGDWAPQAARQLQKDFPQVDQLRSTLNLELQQFVTEAVESQIRSLAHRNVQDAAALVVDNQSGEIKAYVANGGGQSSARHVDGIRALRQVGSTLKPFLYAQALEKKIMTLDTRLDDSAVEFPVAGGSYRPMNYDRIFHGLVPMKIALASSLNVPAVKTLDLLGVNEFYEFLQRFNLRVPFASDYYGPSLALGAIDLSLWDLTRAYLTLANGGRAKDLRWVKGAPTETRVLPAEVTQIIVHILSTKEYRRLGFGPSSPLDLPFPVAAKTGTSKDMRDNWCLGFNDRYTVGVWVGNFSGEPMWNVSGVMGAAPLWAQIMKFLHEQPPQNLSPRSLALASAENLFVRGTDAAQVSKDLASSLDRIFYPSPQMMVAIDPDLPRDLQKIFFTSEQPSAEKYFRLNGLRLGSALHPLPWSPRPGKHKLELINAQSKVLDSVNFSVRGMAQF